MQKKFQIEFFPIFDYFFSQMLGGKRGQEVPGPLKKVPVLLDFFGPRTTGPLGCLSPVLSHPVSGPSRDGTVLLESLGT